MKLGDIKKVNGIICELIEISAPYNERLDILFNFYNIKSGDCFLLDIDGIKTIEKVSEVEIEAVKPKDSFVDVEIDWSEEGGRIKHPKDGSYEPIITDKPLYYTYRGLMLIGYLFGDLEDHLEESPHFHPVTTKGKQIVKKATHAVFAKVVE